MQYIISFIGVMAILWFVWFSTGGPERVRATNPGVFLKPVAPLDSGQSYGHPEDILNRNTYRQ